jgi:hypothetical protein
MNRVNLNLELKGEYKCQVFDGNSILHETDWSSNTILSGGLLDLYNYSIPEMLGYLDFGQSSSYPGKEGYFLDNVYQLTDSTRLKGIAAATSETYTEDTSTRVYYRSFTSLPSTLDTTIREFAIKRSLTGNSFARNTMIPLNIKAGQYVVFFYRLKVNWSSLLRYNLRVNTADNYTYSVPVTGTIYQIPYERTYYNNNQLVLSQTVEDIPSFGSVFPTVIAYGVQNKVNSSFNPVELGYSIDHNTKSVTVSTAYHNVSAAAIGIYKNISNIYLSKDGLVSNTNNFFTTKFKFPLSLYNLDADTTASTSLTFTTGSSGLTLGPYADPYAATGKRSNFFTFNVVYSWREA